MTGDPILDEIWRVRAQMVKENGGIEGYLRYIERLDRQHRQRLRTAKRRRQQARKAVREAT